MLSLFPAEQIVTQSSEGAVTLTTHRIRYTSKEIGRSYNQSIMLEHVTSCEVHKDSQLWLLVLAVAVLVGAFISYLDNNNQAFAGLLTSSIGICGVYWLTRRNLIIIGSPSTKMLIPIKGMKEEQLLEFINNIELSKHKRILALNNRPNVVG